MHEQTAVYHDTSHHNTHLRTVAWITRYPKFRCIVQVTCSDSSSGARTVGDSLVWLRSNATEWNVDCPQIYSFAEQLFWPAIHADSHRCKFMPISSIGVNELVDRRDIYASICYTDSNTLRRDFYPCTASRSVRATSSKTLALQPLMPFRSGLQLDSNSHL